MSNSIRNPFEAPSEVSVKAATTKAAAPKAPSSGVRNPFDTEAPVEIVKKKEPSAPASEAGTSATSPSNSPSISPSSGESEGPTPDEDILPRIVDIAKRQDAAAGTLPMPIQQPNDLISQNMRMGRYNKILQGDTDEIARTIKTERKRVANQKEAAARTRASHIIYGAPNLTDTSSPETDAERELNEYEKQLRPLQKKVAQKIDEDAADKLLSLRGKELQNAAPIIGKERRRKLSDIGEDVSFEGEEGTIDAAAKLKGKYLYGFMPGRVKADDEKYRQQHDFINERGVYAAGAKKLEEQLKRLEQDTKVQLWATGTPEQREALAADPTVRDYEDRKAKYLTLTTAYNNLPSKYPAARYEMERQQIADAWAKRVMAQNKAEDKAAGSVAPVLGEGFRQLRTLLYGDKLNSEEEYRQIAEELDIPIEQVRAHAQNDAVGGNIGVPSYLGRVVRSATGVMQSTGQGLNRLFLDKDKADVINRQIEETKYTSPGAITGSWSANKVFDLMATGLGQFAGFVATAGVAGAPLKGAAFATRIPSVIEAVGSAANFGGTFASGYASSYEGAYQEAGHYTQDEDKRHEYAQQVGIVNGFSEFMLRDYDVATRLLKRTPATTVVDNFFKSGTPFSAGNVMAARMGDFAKTLAYETGEELLPYATEVFAKSGVLGYETSMSETLKGAADVMAETLISTVPMGALSASKVQTSESTQAAFYEAAKNPQKFTSRFQDQFEAGEINEAELNRRNKLVNTVASIASGIPEEIGGKKLTEKQRAERTFNILKQRTLEEQERTADAAIKPEIRKELSEVQKQYEELKKEPEPAPAAPASGRETPQEPPPAPNEVLADLGIEQNISPQNTTPNATQNSVQAGGESQEASSNRSEYSDTDQREQESSQVAETGQEANNSDSPSGSGLVQEEEKEVASTAAAVTRPAVAMEAETQGSVSVMRPPRQQSTTGAAVVTPRDNTSPRIAAEVSGDPSETLEAQFSARVAENDTTEPGQIRQYQSLVQLATTYGRQGRVLSESPAFIRAFGEAIEDVPLRVRRQIDALQSKPQAQREAILTAVTESLEGENPSWDDVSARVQAAYDNAGIASPDRPRLRTRIRDGRVEEVMATEREFNGVAELDTLASHVPNDGEVRKYMSGATIVKAYGEGPKNDQTITAQELDNALEHGENIIEKARDTWGNAWATRMLDYINASTAAPSAKSLMYVSLENALAQEKIADPSRAAELTKMQTAVYTRSQAYAREISLALNFNRLRVIAMRGYDTRETTNAIFTDAEVEQRAKIEKLVEADADAVNKEAAAEPIVLTAADARATEEEKAKEQDKAKPPRKKSTKKDWVSKPDAQRLLQEKINKLREDMKNIQC